MKMLMAIFHAKGTIAHVIRGIVYPIFKTTTTTTTEKQKQTYKPQKAFCGSSEIKTILCRAEHTRYR